MYSKSNTKKRINITHGRLPPEHTRAVFIVYMCQYVCLVGVIGFIFNTIHIHTHTYTPLWMHMVCVYAEPSHEKRVRHNYPRGVLCMCVCEFVWEQCAEDRCASRSTRIDFVSLTLLCQGVASSTRSLLVCFFFVSTRSARVFSSTATILLIFALAFGSRLLSRRMPERSLLIHIYDKIYVQECCIARSAQSSRRVKWNIHTN